MHIWKAGLMTIAALAMSTVVVAQDKVTTLEDMIGARGSAIDGLTERGYTYIRTEKSGDSSYTYWTDNRTDRCVTARVADGKIASIVYAPDLDCQAEGAGGSAAVKGDGFETICGVITGGKTYRYRCEVAETTSAEGKKITVLRYPDIEMKLHWHRENNVGVSIQGMKTVQTTYSTSEGETNFEMDGKTYFYISDKKAARKEVENFKE